MRETLRQAARATVHLALGVALACLLYAFVTVLLITAIVTVAVVGAALLPETILLIRRMAGAKRSMVAAWTGRERPVTAVIPAPCVPRHCAVVSAAQRVRGPGDHGANPEPHSVPVWRWAGNSRPNATRGKAAPAPLADGGVTNNTPVSHAIELGAERIYVLPTENPGIRALPRPPRGAPDAAVNALTRLFGARLQADLARYATAAEMIVLPAANPQHVPLTSFTHTRELIEQALTAARTALAAHDTHPAWARAS